MGGSNKTERNGRLLIRLLVRSLLCSLISRLKEPSTQKAKYRETSLRLVTRVCRESFGGRLGVVWESFGSRSGFVRGSFEIFSNYVLKILRVMFRKIQKSTIS